MELMSHIYAAVFWRAFGAAAISCFSDGGRYKIAVCRRVECAPVVSNQPFNRY